MKYDVFGGPTPRAVATDLLRHLFEVPAYRLAEAIDADIVAMCSHPLLKARFIDPPSLLYRVEQVSIVPVAPPEVITICGLTVRVTAPECPPFGGIRAIQLR